MTLFLQDEPSLLVWILLQRIRIAQAGLELVIFLPLPPSANSTSMYHQKDNYHMYLRISSF